ncbi:MAG: prolipoprotein diacylglyceryl transferase, partial [Schleiferiaceae bacterium]|nr:prolipoprotein diacylglyceryl transferase [Schleiferiaceae bacterium]
AKREGLLFGLFLVGIFGLRIAIEFIKANQKAFEANMELNMGQWLSIPLVVIGVGLIFRSFNHSKS